jgi:hypothetical protein
MERRVLWTVMLALGTALSVGCGDDSGGDDDGAGNSGGAGKSGPTAGAQMITCEEGKITCGTDCCGVPDGVMAEPCCQDDFAGQCGMLLSGFGSQQSCVLQVEPDTRCPSVTIPVINFVLPSCCTDDNQCGIDSSTFGGMGCTDLATARMRAMMFMGGGAAGTTGTAGMSSMDDEDAGVAGSSGGAGMTGGAGRTGGRGMFPGFTFPEPRACD